MSISDSRKKRGRPSTGIGKAIGLRLYPELEATLDAWIEEQPDPKPSRPDAIRKLIDRGAKAEQFELFLPALFAFLEKVGPRAELKTLLVEMRLRGLLERDDIPEARKLLTMAENDPAAGKRTPKSKSDD
jgi:hypothetical protein